MQRYYETVLDGLGNPSSGVACQVVDAASGSPVVLYSAVDDALTATNGISNPVVTGADGIIAFAVPAGRYTLIFTGGGLANRVKPWITLDDNSGGWISAGTLGQFDPTTSAELRGVMTDETGTGSLVFATAPTMTGIQTDTITTSGAATLNSATITTLTATTSSLGAATATTVNGSTIPTSKTLVVTTDKPSVMATMTSADLRGLLSDETGTGVAVFATTPTLVTPVLGVASGTSLTLTGTTAAVSTATGTIICPGGIGVAKDSYFGAELNVANKINVAAISAPTNAGDFYYEGATQSKHGIYGNGIGGWIDKCIFSGYADKTYTGIVTTQSLFTATARGTRTLPANFWKQGKALRYRLSGIYTTDGAPGNATVDIMLGAVTFRTTGSFALDASVTNGYWLIEGAITCYTTGATGTLQGQIGWVHAENAGGTPLHVQGTTTTAAVTVDTTASMAFDVLWTATDAGTSITCGTQRLWEIC